ncbi:MAG: FtsX-like permease family protein [Alphaproteobacteria bacterium]|nr:FtsX-like permease family protein [Alphaproteobacteria bacterium]
MNGFALPLRLALRELRGGLKGFRIFLACLMLGVAAIAGVGSLTASLVQGLREDARIILGGDVELRLTQRAASPEQLAHFKAAGTVGWNVEMRAMARRPDGTRRQLVEMKAVDPLYPLYGRVDLDPPMELSAALEARNGRHGAVMEPAAVERLQLKPGDLILVGESELELRAVIQREPDRAVGALGFGPRLMIAADALPATQLVQPGSLTAHIYRIKLADGVAVRDWIVEANARFPDAGWRARGFDEAAPWLQFYINRLAQFLTLVGLSTLLVGGVGVGNAVKAYLEARTPTIATLKCLGAPARLIFATYLTLVLMLAAGGIVAGLILGVLTPAAIVAAVGHLLPLRAAFGIYPQPLLVATAFGILIALGFALWPLARAQQVPAATLFLDLVAPGSARPLLRHYIGLGLISAALAALAILTASERKMAIWFVIGAIGALIIFRLAAIAIAWAARRVGRVRNARLRLALANLYRPGAPTGSIVLSLGLGLTVLVIVALLQGNLSIQVNDSLPRRAPSFYFINIQPDQADALDRMLAGLPGARDPARVPVVRGRVTRINGVPADQVTVTQEARWVLRGDRGFTYAAKQPEGVRLAAGKWWPPDYQGPPLISFDAAVARGFGVGIGDTITVNVLGREIEARIASLREIDYRSFAINFATIFAPGTLEGAPQSHIATVQVPPAQEDRAEKQVTDAFPNVSVIRVKDALATANRILVAIGQAVQITSMITLLAGALVLAGAVVATHHRRVYEAVVLKVLGARRADIVGAYLMEYCLLGIVTAVIAAIFGSIAAWLIMTEVMRAPFVLLPGTVALAVAVGAAIAVGLGLAGTWHALGQKAAPLLRNE